MPNIHGLFSLGEVALKLSVSSAWINKIQKRTGIVQKEGGKGQVSYFSEEEIEILRNVKLLRVLDYSLEDIKDLYDQEKAMMELVGSKEEPEPEESEEKYIVHFPYGYSNLVTAVQDGPKEDDCLYFRAKMKTEVFDQEDIPVPDEIDGRKYIEIQSSIKAIFREVNRRALQLQEDLKRFL